MSQREALVALKQKMSQRIIGQEAFVERLLIALLADGHLLVEGPPGLAKTTAIKALADGIEGDFHRIQFTPDLLPADLTGTEIYRQQTGQFEFQRGPLFHNLILADEINRAPAKVQSALLEAMAEHQITVGATTHQLPRLFLVMATQNPLEQEGTYPLPEAQLDRFLLHVTIDYPEADAETEILRLSRAEFVRDHSGQHETAWPRISEADLFAARGEVAAIHLSPALEQYMVQLVMATRQPQRYSPDLARLIRFGVSPRATIALERASRARAWLHGRDFVSPEDVQAMLPDVMRHRLLLSFEAEAEGLLVDDVIVRLLAQVAVP